MRVALWQGFPFHFEMIGYIVDFCLHHGIDYDVYCQSVNQCSWKAYYDNMFDTGHKIWLHTCDSVDLSSYGVVFLLTDDDPTFTESMRNTYGSKTVCIEHWYKQRVPGFATHIGLRYSPLEPMRAFALPTYQAVSKEAKTFIVDNDNTIHVALLGSCNVPTSPDALYNLFENTKGIMFHAMAREIQHDLSTASNIKTYANIPTTQMFDVLNQCSYVMCIGSHRHHEEIISGSIPLAFNVGARLIIPRSWNELYQFKSCLEYDDNTKLRLSKKVDLDLVYAELVSLIETRDQVLIRAIESCI